MAKLTTVGKAMVNAVLPNGYSVDDVTLGKKEMDAILQELVKENPDEYGDIVHSLIQLGRHAAYEEGTTYSLDDLEIPFDKSEMLQHVEEQENRIEASDMSEEEKDAARTAVYSQVQKFLTDNTLKAALSVNNPFGMQVKAKARGNPMQLAALLTTPSVYQDPEGNTIPVFIRNSYAEGLEPHEYWAATYGGRKGIVSTKFATRDAGYIGKQFGNAMRELVVTEKDCGTPYGVPIPADDDDSIGAVLARRVGNFPAGTVIDKHVLAEARKRKIDEIVVRSPMSCNTGNGVCQKCTGIRETGDFPEIGYHLGYNASSALAERIAQGSLNAKHCLCKDTEVLCGDWSIKRISELKVGDTVMGSDTEGNMRPVKVLNIYDNGLRDCWRTEFISNGTHQVSAERVHVDGTLDHKILATRLVVGQLDEALNGKWREIPLGQKSRQFYAKMPNSFDDTGSLKRISQTHLGMLPTYDIEVDHPDHLFVLANGLIVSNSGGQKATGDAQYSGFEYIRDMSNIPSAFPSRAALSELDGEVTDVSEAPQGGYNITVNDQVHYVEPGIPVHVKKGDQVEAGDQLSGGLINPADVTRLKGIGEGRRYFARRMTAMFRDSGLPTHRRNMEALARSMIDHVKLDDTANRTDYLPGDIVNYNAIRQTYKPRKDATPYSPKDAVGKYLEMPALHYTIGTRVTRKMADELKKHKVDSIVAHNDKPEFESHMLSLTKNPAYSGDWLSRLGANYLKERLTRDVQHGSTSAVHGINPIPGIVAGTEFGKQQGKKFTF